MEEVFSELKPSELGTFETMLRRIGKHAQKLLSEKLEGETL